ncbi:helix-turn-helix domain-containing protein [Pseudonocardia acaciae]|uniref:helix-turn-helix domain-containing protein n=1 Tax=Pseudonocardia acaciae TaxID=551276 RepID=UPI001B80CDF5|nr:XRE family transcriptional regulator [Pseudonocardia acaciae]
MSRAVAANLRALRARRAWSLDALAHRSGVSKGVLVALEADRGNPSLNTLCRLADAFSVSLTQLVDADRPPVLRGAPVAEASALWHGPSGGYGRLVLSTDPPNPVELWWWRLEPGEARHSEAHAAGTREAVMVIAGEAVIEADGQRTTVPKGHAATWPGDRPHVYRNDGAAPADLVMIVTVPG